MTTAPDTVTWATVVDRLVRIISRLVDNHAHRPVLVGIDGPCGSGKSTLADRLHASNGVGPTSVIRMDDFFLRPEQRSTERLAEVGGNIDAERFTSEVIQPLLKSTAFTYRPFDCRTGLLGEPIAVTPEQAVIIEGAYSFRPPWLTEYDLTVLCAVSPEVQHQRLTERSPDKLEQFEREWIPAEKAYFDHYQFSNLADITLDTSCGWEQIGWTDREGGR